MNAKMIFKTVFLIAILLLLVLMGMNNRDTVSFKLAPLLKRPLVQPAAIMYFGFFAVGLVTGTIIALGGGKRGSGASASRGKSDKS